MEQTINMYKSMRLPWPINKFTPPSMKPISGCRIFPRTPVKIRTTRIGRPQRSSKLYLYAAAGDRKDVTMRLPSRGGNGNRFRAINTMLIMIPTLAISTNSIDR